MAGLAAFHGSLAAAARAVGVSRGTLDGVISGRHGLGEQSRQRIEAYLNDRQQISSPDAKLAKDLGRVIEYQAAGRVKPGRPGQTTFRNRIQALKGEDRTAQRKQVSLFVARQKELAGRSPRPVRRGTPMSGLESGGGGGSGGSGTEESSDEEWYAEYGAWVEEVEQWRTSQEGELPGLEGLPF